VDTRFPEDHPHPRVGRAGEIPDETNSLGIRYDRSQETSLLRSYPYKGHKVQNVLITCDLDKISSLPDPLEDHNTAIPNKTARGEELVIRSTELHPSNLS